MSTRAVCVPIVALAMLSVPVAARAQQVLSGSERLDSDRPEAWAVKYVTSTTLLSGLGIPEPNDPGSLSIGGELVWIPFLTSEQQRVGFRGTKIEDLNKAPFFVRPRIIIGLPEAFALTVAFVPPAEMFGVRPRFFALALERPMYRSEAWGIGWRAYGQTGSVKAAVTCPEEVAALGPDSPRNPAGCLASSADVAALRYAGLELGVGSGTARRRLAPHVAVAANYFHNRFQTNAHRLDLLEGALTEFVDRTEQRSAGVTFSATAGVTLRLSRRLDGTIDVFYAPLWVKRQSGAPRQNDGLLNAKALLRYRLR